jgi:hypothetical protein
MLLLKIFADGNESHRLSQLMEGKGEDNEEPV